MQPPSLREAWTRYIRPEDYESHMASVGQAQANAKLVENYLRAEPLRKDSSVLFTGAGTGQMFDFVSPALLLPFETTFTDINAAYLRLLAERFRGLDGLRYVTCIDDVESSQLAETFSLVVAVLILEHVDWRKAVATIARLSNQNVLAVIQENPSQQATALNPARPITGTMNILVDVRPQLIPGEELFSEFARYGFTAEYRAEQGVADGKKMLAFGFHRQT